MSWNTGAQVVPACSSIEQVLYWSDGTVRGVLMVLAFQQSNNGQRLACPFTSVPLDSMLSFVSCAL